VAPQSISTPSTSGTPSVEYHPQSAVVVVDQRDRPSQSPSRPLDRLGVTVGR
jgi:hypothetical protein